MAAEYLLLKWGTLKGWKVESEACLAALRKYHDGSASMSAAMQRDSAGQKQALCELIDAIDGTPVLDIKPVMAEFLPRSPLRQPTWSHELMADYWAGTGEG